MKLLIISDSHGNIASLKHILGFAKKFEIDAVVHCGDWDNIESVNAVLSFGTPLYTILGNADIDPGIGKILKAKSEKFNEDILVFGLGGRKIGITHKPSNNKKFFGGRKLDVIFNGHQHSKDENIVNDIKIVRPGPIINGNNFAIYDTKTNIVEFVQDVQV